MYACMSWDHRVVDGGYAAQFLNSVSRRAAAWSQ
jgi:pyruvate/2-oxoglutarate dehydrogenase complex dihydrolipoamide acyltransferase (E2) component